MKYFTFIIALFNIIHSSNGQVRLSSNELLNNASFTIPVSEPSAQNLTFILEGVSDITQIQKDDSGSLLNCNSCFADIDGAPTLKLLKVLQENRVGTAGTLNLIISGIIDNTKFDKKFEIKFDEEPEQKVSSLSIILEIPFPRFWQEEEAFEPRDPRARYLIIDGHSNYSIKRNNLLCKWKEKKPEKEPEKEAVKKPEKEAVKKPEKEVEKDGSFEVTHSLPVKGTLSVFLLNLNLKPIKSITVNLDGYNYMYELGTEDVYAFVKSNPTLPTEINELTSGGTDSTKSDTLYDSVIEYLNGIITYLNSKTIINIADYKEIQKHQNELEKVLNDSSDILYTEELRSLIDSILYWSPKYVCLTPIAYAIPDKDKTEVKVEIEYFNSNTETITVGTFRIHGGINFSMGSSVYATGLVNRAIYVDSVKINNKVEMHAKLDSTNSTSIGIGVNFETYFRTGSMVVPTINLGFFVPFEEELTPFASLGPGISLLGENVKWNFAGGLAMGKINQISSRYENKDLTSIPDLINAQLEEKAWKSSWFVSVGVGYNISKETD